jgi:hypothetical protein
VDYKRMHRKMKSRIDVNTQSQSWKETNASRIKRLLYKSTSDKLPLLKAEGNCDKMRSKTVNPLHRSIGNIISKCNDYALEEVIPIDK